MVSTTVGESDSAGFGNEEGTAELAIEVSLVGAPLVSALGSSDGAALGIPLVPTVGCNVFVIVGLGVTN